MKNLLKRRKYSLKNRLYIEADYLNKTNFKIGTNIKYNINHEEKSITIIACDENTNNHVASVTQTRTKKVVPTIDIRKSDVREFLNNAKELEVYIYEDQIVFSVIANEKEQLQENLLKDENNNVIELATYKNSKAKEFAINISTNKIAIGENRLSQLFTVENSDSFYNLGNKAISLVSLFSGAGLLDKGFLDNGNYKIKFAIDKFEKKRLKRYHLDTYRYNIGDHIVEGDVLELTKDDIPQSDFVIGGVPCVKFSKLNTKDNFRNSLENDYPLLEQFLNVVEWTNAKGFLIENVKEFVNTKGQILLNRIKTRMKDFNITCKIINGVDLGSAQSRPRAFILGFKNIIPKLEVPKVSIVKTVRDAFKGVENAPQHDLRLKLINNYLEMAKHIPQGGNLFDVPEELRPNRSFGNAIQRLHYDRPSPTITGIDSDYIVHPIEDRKISVREAARLFSLPDDFIFIGSTTSIFTQLKNGVDYKVSSFLAKTIYDQIITI